jgi:hypothetical protein
VSIEEGLQRTIEWTRENLEVISKTIEKHDSKMAELSNS